MYVLDLSDVCNNYSLWWTWVLIAYITFTFIPLTKFSWGPESLPPPPSLSLLQAGVFSIRTIVEQPLPLPFPFPPLFSLLIIFESLLNLIVKFNLVIILGEKCIEFLMILQCQVLYVENNCRKQMKFLFLFLFSWENETREENWFAKDRILV